MIPIYCNAYQCLTPLISRNTALTEPIFRFVSIITGVRLASLVMEALSASFWSVKASSWIVMEMFITSYSTPLFAFMDEFPKKLIYIFTGFLPDIN